MLRKMLVALALAAGLSAEIAKADIPVVFADVACDEHRAVARFGQGYEGHPLAFAELPPEVDRGLTAMTPANRRHCVLSEGTEIRLRIGSMQAFGYGMGGAEPPQFFSLWIDRRKVISRRVWRPGYEQSFDARVIVAVVATRTTLSTCSVGSHTGDKVVCASEPLDLTAMQVDEVEYPPPGTMAPAPGSMLLPVGADNELCRALVKRGSARDIGPGARVLFDYSFLPELQPDVSVMSWIDPSILTPIDTLAWPAVALNKVAPLDIDGDGRLETVIQIHHESHAFDGTYWIAVANGVPLNHVERDIFPDPALRDRPKPIGENKTWFVYAAGRPGLYPDVQASFVHLDGYTYQGRVLFLAHALHERHDPTAVLVKPLPKGQFETLCAFQVVRPNF